MVAVCAAKKFEVTLAEYVYERSEEARAVRVGEKESSEQAAIVARYADLFTRDTFEQLTDEVEEAGGEERERLERLRQSCLDGLLAQELVQMSDALENYNVLSTSTPRCQFVCICVASFFLNCALFFFICCFVVSLMFTSFCCHTIA